MKVFFILIFSSVCIFASCKKCNCEGGSPEISSQNEALILFKNDTTIDFIINQTDIVQVKTSQFHDKESHKSKCAGVGPFNLFSKNCDCASDEVITDGYNQRSVEDSISFSLIISTEKTGSSVRYNFNEHIFFEFDSINLSKTINNKLISDLSVKYFPNVYDSISYIYYKESVGLVSVVYKNGNTLDLK